MLELLSLWCPFMHHHQTIIMIISHIYLYEHTDFKGSKTITLMNLGVFTLHKDRQTMDHWGHIKLLFLDILKPCGKRCSRTNKNRHKTQQNTASHTQASHNRTHLKTKIKGLNSSNGMAL